MSGTRITVVLPPWVTARDQRDALVRAAAALRADGGIEAIEYTGHTMAATVAARVAELLGAAARRLVIFPSGVDGETAAALVAARLGGCTLGRCIRVALAEDAVTARRAVFGGRAEIALRSTATVTCATLPPDSPEGLPSAREVSVRVIDAGAPPPFETEVVPIAASLPRVEGAAIVVSGGRGIGSPEGFALLARIAAALGAGLGGSLPAVDAGWVPVAHQVGQSGKFVAPKLYFAVGISGTPQHLAGVARATRLVALNADREAPIFSRSSVGVQGDWREILPLLVRELEGSCALIPSARGAAGVE